MKSLRSPQSRLPGLAIFLVLFATLTACYWPLLSHTFAFADDYDALVMEKPFGQLLKLCFMQGRWIDALFIHGMFITVTQVRELCWVRLFGIATDALLACMIVRAMRRAGWPTWSSVCLSLIVASLPSAQILVGWAIEFGIPISGVLAGISVELTARAAALPASKADRPAQFCLIAGAISAMIASLLIYQSCAMFFWFFTAIALFPPHGEVTSARRITLLGIVGLGSLPFGLAAVKIAAILHPDVNPGHSTQLATNIASKAVWFVTDPLPTALNQAKLVPSNSVAIAIALLIAVGLPFYFRPPAPADKPQSRWALVGIAIALIPLSYLVNLAVAESVSLYRTQFPLEALVSFYLLLAIFGICRALRLRDAIPIAIACLWTAASLVLANLHIRAEIAEPQAAEWQFVMATLGQAPLDRISTIEVILATPDDSCAPYLRTDEFGIPSACQPGMARNEIRLALAELHQPQKPMRILTDPQAAGSDRLLIDFRKLRELAADERR